MNGLLALRPRAGVGDTERPGIVHRLDRETSGLLVVEHATIARLRALQSLLRRRRIHRGYTALVRGRPAVAAGHDRGADRPRPARPDADVARLGRRPARRRHALRRSPSCCRATRCCDVAARDRPHPPDPRAPGGDRTARWPATPSTATAQSSGSIASSCTRLGCVPASVERRAGGRGLAAARRPGRGAGRGARRRGTNRLDSRGFVHPRPGGTQVSGGASMQLRGSGRLRRRHHHQPFQGGDCACPQSPCESCSRPAFTSAIRRGAGTRRCGVSSSASAAASTSSTCSRPSIMLQDVLRLRAEHRRAERRRCCSSAPRSRPRTLSRSRRAGSASRT